ncbi:cytochrome P450 10-like isoform X2 [Oculina patagonica]
MDEALYLVCSALLISIVVWLLNPFGKLHNFLSYLLRRDNGPHSNLSEGVRSFDEMPGPKGLPYFGDVINYLKNFEFKAQMAELKNSFEKYGPIFKRTIMGRTIVFIQDPRDVEIVFKADGKYPVRATRSTAGVMYRKSRNRPQGVGALEGEDWSRLRRALASKMLRPKDVRENLDNFNAVTRDAIEHMVAIRGADDVIPDLEGELAKYATESVGTMAFDERVGLYDDPPNEETVKMVKATFDAFKYMGKLSRGLEGLIFRFVRTPTYWKFCEAQDTAIGISQKIVDKKVMDLKKTAEEAVPLLTYLIMKGELTPQEISMNSISMFRAGVDTTSGALLWLLYDLACNLEVQEKLYEEVISLIGPHGDFNPDSFAKLVYVKACLKESMRLHPGAYGWPRILNQDVVLCGYQVPSGTTVVYLNYLSGRSEELFKFPLEFKPERWLNEDLGKIHPFASLPFGVGPRMCLGRRIAEAEIYLLATKLVQRFRLEYHEDPVEMKLRFFVVPDRSLKIKFIDR